VGHKKNRKLGIEKAVIIVIIVIIIIIIIKIILIIIVYKGISYTVHV